MKVIGFGRLVKNLSSASGSFFFSIGGGGGGFAERVGVFVGVVGGGMVVMVVICVSCFWCSVVKEMFEVLIFCMGMTALSDAK